MPKISVNNIKKLINRVFSQTKVPSSDVEIITDTIIYSHLIGRATHGITRLPIYIKKIKNGSLNPLNEIQRIKETPVISVYDGKHGFGQVLANFGINKAIEKSDKYGIGIVGIRNSNNFGTISYFLNQIVKNNKIGVIMTNSAPAVAPWGGNKALFGTNPIGFCFPTPQGIPPIILDMATSIVARGKIRLAAKRNQTIPFGWALDKEGNPTQDPNLALKGSLLPIGDHKGSGLSLVVDFFSGLLTGSSFGGMVRNLNTDGEKSKNGHFIMVIDPFFFQEENEYNLNVQYLINSIKKTGNNVFYPGEKSFKLKVNNNGIIEISDNVYKEIILLCKQLKIQFNLNLYGGKK